MYASTMFNQLVCIKFQAHCQQIFHRITIVYRSRKSELKNRSLAKLPSVSAFVAQNKGGHRFISRTRLYLIVRTIALLAFAAFEQVGLRSLYSGELRVIDGFFFKLFAQLFYLVACHLFRGHHRKSSRCDRAHEEVGSQIGIFHIAQVGDSATYLQSNHEIINYKQFLVLEHRLLS